MHTTVSKLKAGPTLLSTPMGGVESLTIICAVPVGSRHERSDQAGLAHFYEHMVFKGGRRFRSATAISETLDQYGAQFNALTDSEMTAFYIKISAAHAEVAVAVLADILQHARFPQAEVEREKGVVLEEHKMYWDMPDARADMQLGPLMFGRASLGRPVIGSPARIRQFTARSLREWRRHYGAERMAISVAGKIPRGLTRLLESSFGDLPSAEMLPQEKPRGWSDGPRWTVDPRPGEQTQLLLGWPGLPHQDERQWTLRLLRTILGGYTSSRLFTEIREKRGLCYTVRAFEQSYADTGLVGVAAGLDSQRLPEAMQAITRELERLINRPVPAHELQRAKEYLKGNLVIGLESTYSVSWWRVGQWLTEGRLLDLPSTYRHLDAVTADDLRQLARELFQPSRTGVVLVGPPVETAALRPFLLA